MNQITIECKKITKRFDLETDENATLRGIDLIAHENETVMLMGPSGAEDNAAFNHCGDARTDIWRMPYSWQSDE